MTGKESAKHTATTIQITEKDLQSTLDDFLEDKKDAPKSIWNVRTVTGLVFILLAFTYIGHLISSELLGFEALSFLSSFIQISPYIAGALLFIISLGMLKKSKKDKIMDKEKEYQKQKSKDNLDKFLYAEGAYSHSGKTSGSGWKASSYAETDTGGITGGLRRSRTDKRILGVCGGLAKQLGVSSTIIRIIFVAAFLLGYGSFILVYIALGIIMPKEPIDLMDDFN